MLGLRCHETHEAPKMMKKVLHKLVVQVWSSQVLWIDVEIFRNVLESLTIVFRPRSIWASIEIARRILTEFLLVTTIQGGQTNLWLPILFSFLCWEILCPGKLWKWTDLEQDSTLFQVFWLCSHCCWLSFCLKFRKNRKAIAQQVMKHLMSNFVYQNKLFSVLRFFRPEVEWYALHLRLFFSKSPTYLSYWSQGGCCCW